MYCTKCGKQIDYDTPICLECTAVLAIKAKQAREAAKAAEASSAPIVNPVSIANPVNEAQSVPSYEEAQIEPSYNEAQIEPSYNEAHIEPSYEETQNVESAEQSERSYEKAQSEWYAEPIEHSPVVEQPYVAEPAPVMYPYQTVVVPEAKPKTRMKGFGAALASAILATIAMVVLGLGYALLLADIKLIGLIVVAIFFAMMVVSLVLGIKSILTFKSVVRAKNPAPIATLILGIYSLAMSVEGFIMGISYVADGLNILDYFHFT